MITYATFNPSDKGSGVTLSSGNLVASSSAGANSGVRTTISKTTGKWYWEFTITTGSEGLLGVADGSATLSGPPGQDSHAYAYFEVTGQKFYNSALSSFGASFSTGDVIGFALDADAGIVKIYKNNSLQGTITLTGLSAPYFAMIGNGAGSGSLVVSANFGASTLTYTPPSGYNAGLYTGTASEPPVLDTLAATDITTTTAILNGEITDVGSGDATARGFVYGTSSHGDPGDVAPTSSGYASYTTESGTFGAATFNDGVTGLSVDTTYYVRAWAQNGDGYAYGDEVSFNTDTVPPFRFTNLPGIEYDETDTTTIYAERLNDILERLEALEG